MPFHVWDHVTDPLAQAFSAPVASGNVWVREGAAWLQPVAMWVYDAGAWQQFYASFAPFPPAIAPTGSTAVVGSSTVTLDILNRQPQWRVRGTQTLFDFGVQQQQTTLDELSSGPFVQNQLGISTTGEVRWDVRFYDPISGADGPSQLFSIFF